MRKKTIKIQELEKRLMLDASLGDLATTVVFAEETVNAAPVILDSDASVTGSTTNFDGESLTISTDGGADDQISINDEGTGAGQIGFDGTNVSYEGTVIGTVSSDGTNGADLIIDFDADASKQSIERLIENINYAHTSDDPATSRTLTFALGVYFSENMDVVIVAYNEGPSVDTNAGLTLNEGATKTITSTELGISDLDHDDTEVTISITDDVDNGRIELSTNAGVAITSFTLDDLNNGLVRYVHDDSQTTSDQFTFNVTDGDITTPDENFDITVTAVDDPLTLDTNTGTTLSLGEEIGIGAQEIPARFGTQVHSISGVGQHARMDGYINNQNTQLSLVFTTPSSTPNSVPGQVLFETGGSGRGIGLYLNNQGELTFYAGNAQSSPLITSPAALNANAQYAVVVEIDNTNNELRLHYAEASDFDWFSYGRSAEASLKISHRQVFPVVTEQV